MQRMKNKLRIVKNVNDCFEHGIEWKTQVNEDLSIIVERKERENDLITGRYKFAFYVRLDNTTVNAQNLETGESYSTDFDMDLIQPKKGDSDLIVFLLGLIHKVETNNSSKSIIADFIVEAFKTLNIEWWERPEKPGVIVYDTDKISILVVENELITNVHLTELGTYNISTTCTIANDNTHQTSLSKLKSMIDSFIRITK